MAYLDAHSKLNPTSLAAAVAINGAVLAALFTAAPAIEKYVPTAIEIFTPRPDPPVRILVGTNGRVLQIAPVGNADADFFAATRRQALGKWRFRPATRDGVPIEAWRQISVRFELNS